MKLPPFISEVIELSKKSPLWGVAYLAVLLLPVMLIFARAGGEICVGLMGILFLAHSWRTRRWGWVRDPFMVVCFVAWGWLVLVVTPLAGDIAHSAKEALLWIRFPLMFAALRYWILAPRAARTTLAALLGTLLVLVMVDTLWQLLTNMSLTGHARIISGRLTGPFVTPKVGLYLGKILLPALALGGAAAIAAQSRKWMVLLALLPVPVILTILLSGERSVLLVTLLGLGIAAALAMLRSKQLRVPILFAGVALLAIIVGLFETNEWVHLRGTEAWKKISHYSQSDYGLLFTAAYDMGRANMLHGVGIGGFRDACPQLYYEGQPFRGMHPHHAFMEWFAETGLPGVLLFLVMIGVLLREGVQHFRAAKGSEFLVPALALGIVAQHFFPLIGMQSFFSNWAAMLLWFAIGSVYAAMPTVIRPRTKD